MKRAIVIGASSGIGREIALQLAAAGYQVAITARRVHLLEEVQKQYPDRISLFPMDVTQTDEAVTTLTYIIMKQGGLDLAVVSAGWGELNPELDYAIEQSTLAVNVVGFTAVVDSLFTYFRSRGEGHLVGITSISGIRGEAQAPAYNATKAFQRNYLEGLRKRAQKERKEIYVTDICPGSVDTAMMKGEGHFWITSASTAARMTLQAIRKKQAVRYVSGRWGIIAWLLRHLPRRLYDKL